MSFRSKLVLSAFLVMTLAPAIVACKTDDGLFDRDEGHLEEAAEEVDEALDR